MSSVTTTLSVGSALSVLARSGYIERFDVPGRRMRGTRLLKPDVLTSQLKLDEASVTTTMRQQRYVVPKLIAGVPVDNIALTRFAALSAETFPPEATAFRRASSCLAMSPRDCAWAKESVSATSVIAARNCLRMLGFSDPVPAPSSDGTHLNWS